MYIAKGVQYEVATTVLPAIGAFDYDEDRGFHYASYARVWLKETRTD